MGSDLEISLFLFPSIFLIKIGLYPNFFYGLVFHFTRFPLGRLSIVIHKTQPSG